MAFMMKKKRYKFHVDISELELSEVSYSKAILFAKVRQLDGGNFSDVSKRMEVQNHRVQYNARFQFLCKMNANATSGILDTCKCRISIRMEEKGGRNFRKLGFTDINLAEYAGVGQSTQRYILQPYDLNHRLDNSILQVKLNITLREGDTIFQRPLTRTHPIQLPGEDEKSRTNVPNPSINTLKIPSADLVIPANEADEDPSHTRNSSTTSQASVGYSSQNSGTGNSQPGHSRQSSSGGESSHGRNLSQGSSDTGFFGSMEKDKRRKKVDDTKPDAEDVIDELLEGVDLKQGAPEEADTSGQLKLYVGPDGSVSLDNRASKKNYEQVVFDRDGTKR